MSSQHYVCIHRSLSHTQTSTISTLSHSHKRKLTISQIFTISVTFHKTIQHPRWQKWSSFVSYGERRGLRRCKLRVCSPGSVGQLHHRGRSRRGHEASHCHQLVRHAHHGQTGHQLRTSGSRKHVHRAVSNFWNRTETCLILLISFKDIIDTVETVAFCSRGNLLYMRIYFRVATIPQNHNSDSGSDSVGRSHDSRVDSTLIGYCSKVGHRKQAWMSRSESLIGLEMELP